MGKYVDNLPRRHGGHVDGGAQQGERVVAVLDALLAVARPLMRLLAPAMRDLLREPNQRHAVLKLGGMGEGKQNHKG